MINLTALNTAFVARLTGDAPLMLLVGGVTDSHVPQLSTWALPWLRFNTQSHTRDVAAPFNQRSWDILITLMAFDKGGAPGIGSLDRCNAALLRAATTLTASRLVVAGMTVWDWEQANGVPGTMPADNQGYLRPQCGLMFQARVDE